MSPDRSGAAGAAPSMQFGGDGAAALRRVRDCLYSASVSASDVRRYLRRTQRESQRALLDLAWPQHLWIRPSIGLPAIVAGAANDAFFFAHAIEEAARFHGVRPKVFAHMAHAMMLEPGWDAVAEHVHAWLEERMIQT